MQDLKSFVLYYQYEEHFLWGIYQVAFMQLAAEKPIAVKKGLYWQK